LRIARRREAVEEPGVRQAVQGRQSVACIPNEQRQAHALRREIEAMPARRQCRVLREQARAPGFEFGPPRKRRDDVFSRERIALGAHEVELCVIGRRALEQPPGAKKVQSGAEASLSHDKASRRRHRGKSLGKTVALQEDVCSLLHCAGTGEVAVAETAGDGLSVVPV